MRRDGVDDSGYKSTALAARYKALADFVKVDFFDAGGCVVTEGVDGIHFTAANNRDLGRALAEKVRSVVPG